SRHLHHVDRRSAVSITIPIVRQRCPPKDDGHSAWVASDVDTAAAYAQRTCGGDLSDDWCATYARPSDVWRPALLPQSNCCSPLGPFGRVWVLSPPPSVAASAIASLPSRPFAEEAARALRRPRASQRQLDWHTSRKTCVPPPSHTLRRGARFGPAPKPNAP